AFPPRGSLPARPRERPPQKVRACAPSWELLLPRASAAYPTCLGPRQGTREFPRSEIAPCRDAAPTPHFRFLSANQGLHENCRVPARSVPTIPLLPRRSAPEPFLLPAPSSRRRGSVLSVPSPHLLPVFPERIRESFPASRTATHRSHVRPAGKGSYPPWMPYRRAGPNPDHLWYH